MGIKSNLELTPMLVSKPIKLLYIIDYSCIPLVDPTVSVN